MLAVAADDQQGERSEQDRPHPPAKTQYHTCLAPLPPAAVTCNRTRGRHERASAQRAPGRLGAAAAVRGEPEAGGAAGQRAVRRPDALRRLPPQVSAGQRLRRGSVSEGQWNPKDWSAFQVFSISLMTSEIISMEAQTQRRGLKAIFDLQGWSLGHAWQINPSLARKISSVLSDSFPLKVRGIHLVNEPMFFRPVFAMIRPFLPEKIKQRIHMHGVDYHDTLGDFFSSAILPPEYGGEGPGIEEVCQDWTNQLLRKETLLQQIATHPTADIAITAEDSLISGEETEG
ncbi:alpha-tocopherol transfer protein isoform X2 [Trachinotus anak]|uniref:alpha-tocopherol transfer protein isoform X2 n=1 Tax=Trachinotus anak TaxID=443729 RepID=UPI0039F1DD93